MTPIAVILARGGSKRLPGKNLLQINGKSLTQLAVECALENDLLTILSSDSHEILSQHFNRSPVLFQRSKESASDTATSEIAVLEVLNSFGFGDEEEVILLPPTSPTRSAKHLRTFLLAWNDLKVTSTFTQAISVVENRQDFWIHGKQGAERIRTRLSGKSEPRRTQERTPWFLETSAIYLSNVGQLRRTESFVGDQVALIPLDPITAMDIDSEIDFQLARLFLETKSNE
jgi:CMP-N,N'-diacetyllegionaminic acid synthase